MDKKKRNFQRPSDSYLTHLFARTTSVRITPLFAKTPITPLQVTFIGLIFGLIAAWIGSNHYWMCGILAAILMETSHVLDCVDGELARLTGRGHPFAANLDPISDRIKDMAVIFSSCLQAEELNTFGIGAAAVFKISYFSLGLWFLYLYIVDAYLNPARKKKGGNEDEIKRRVYFGLYDFFIYGSIVFWLMNKFEYFVFYVATIATIGIPVQLIKLKSLHSISRKS